MICQHAGCTTTATVKTRFGDGTFVLGGSHASASKAGRPSSPRAGRARHRMTFVHYCDGHFQEVDRLFLLFDVRLLAAAA